MGQFPEILKKQPPVTRGTPCSIRLAFDAIGPEESGELLAALRDPHVNSVAIATALGAAYGINVRKWVVQRHRRGECACEEALR